MFDTVLVANRGEIAIRVMQAARDLGLRCVAVYSEADRDAPHVAYADDAYLIGPPSSSESYLNIEKVIATAREAGAGAIHPGYGFLAENSKFARAVREAGLVFIGPPAESMDRMGGKVPARQEATAADVPVVPGTLNSVESYEEVEKLGAEYGYPIAIKAVGGGGGRGLRVVHNASEIQSAFDSARREAEVSFNNIDLYVEKYLSDPRHIEIQVLADTHGNVVYVGERDCSVQRRHQKLIEECPSPVMSPELRAEMGAAAVRLAKSVNYVSAGTLEFLLQDGQFYFLEMNTRIQVEHTVTEMVYGIDLVKAQIRVAQGEKLWITQEELQPRGHAIECRINAEDPRANFRPALGTIGAYKEPSGLGVRVDSGVKPGWTIPQYYDSLISKLITWGADRKEALQRMNRALRDYVVESVITTIPFHRAAMEHPEFVAGRFSVNFIPRHPELIERATQLLDPAPEPQPAPEPADARMFQVEVNGRRFQVRVAEPGREVDESARKRMDRMRGKGGAQSGVGPKVDGVISPLQGRVAAVRAGAGDAVEAGQVLFVIEAMKMENEITAPHAGTISEIKVEVGVTVEAGAVMATFVS